MTTLSHADEIRKAAVVEYFENLNLDIEAEYARCQIIEPKNAAQILRKDLDRLKSRLYFLWQIIDIEDIKSNAAEWVPDSDEAWHMSHIALSQHPHDMEITDILVFGNAYKVDDIYDTIRHTEGAERYGFQLLEQLGVVQEQGQKLEAEKLVTYYVDGGDDSGKIKCETLTKEEYDEKYSGYEEVSDPIYIWGWGDSITVPTHS